MGTNPTHAVPVCLCYSQHHPSIQVSSTIPAKPFKTQVDKPWLTLTPAGQHVSQHGRDQTSPTAPTNNRGVNYQLAGGDVPAQVCHQLPALNKDLQQGAQRVPVSRMQSHIHTSLFEGQLLHCSLGNWRNKTKQPHTPFFWGILLTSHSTRCIHAVWVIQQLETFSSAIGSLSWHTSNQHVAAIWVTGTAENNTGRSVRLPGPPGNLKTNGTRGRATSSGMRCITVLKCSHLSKSHAIFTYLYYLI